MEDEHFISKIKCVHALNVVAGDKLYQDGATEDVALLSLLVFKRGVFPFLPKVYHIPAIPTYICPSSQKSIFLVFPETCSSANRQIDS